VIAGDRRLPALAASGGGLLALTAIGISELEADAIGRFVLVALAQGAVYGLAAWLASRGGLSRGALVMILAIAAAMRLAVLAAPPSLSTDLYRYIWDGRVQSAGINPYRYIPADRHLEPLRDDAIFPNINRSTYAPTIYPPVAEMIFLAVTRLGEGVFVMKAAMVAFEIVAVAALLRLLALSALPAERILLYVWHPLPIWEFAGSGHVDAAVIAFIALALWACRRGKPWGAGIALGCAALVKFFPAVIFPALYRRWDWRMPAAFAAVLLGAYLPYLGAGSAVFGFLSGYAHEEGFGGAGSGFYLWSLAEAFLRPGRFGSGLAYVAVAAALMAALAVAVLRHANGADRGIGGATLLAAAFTFLLSPHYPWYFTWLLTFCCFAPSLSLLYLTNASVLLYLAPVGSLLVADTRRLLVESAIYLPFAALALLDLRRLRRPAAAGGSPA